MIVLFKDPEGNSISQFSVVCVKSFIEPLLSSNSFLSNCNDAIIAFRKLSDIFVHIAKLIELVDPRLRSPETIEAIKKEVKSLLERGKIKVILKEEIYKDAIFFGARFVLAIKSVIDRQIKLKAG